METFKTVVFRSYTGLKKQKQNINPEPKEHSSNITGKGQSNFEDYKLRCKNITY